MSLPSLTKNEKLILFSVILVLTLFWTVVGGYVWFKTKELQENSEQAPNVKNPLAFLENITPGSKNTSTTLPLPTVGITPETLPPNPQIEASEIVRITEADLKNLPVEELPIMLLDNGVILLIGRVKDITAKDITVIKDGKEYRFGVYKDGHINYLQYDEEKKSIMGRDWNEIKAGDLIHLYLFYSKEKGEYEAVQAWLGRNIDLENYKKRL